MYIQFKTISQRDKTMWVILFLEIIISTILLLVMPSLQYKSISIGSCIFLVLCAVILIFFTKTNGIPFIDEKFKK